MAQLGAALQQNPQMLQMIIQQIARQNPALLQALGQNPEALQQLMQNPAA